MHVGASTLLKQQIDNSSMPSQYRLLGDNQQCRNHWVEEQLAAIPTGHRILDAGAGERRFKKACSHLEYVSQDFAEYDGVGDCSGLQTGDWDQNGLDIVSDITCIPEPDGVFDAILCVEVLEHLPSPLLAIKELSRLLKPGGVIIITAPFCSLTHFSPFFFQTGFSRYFYEKNLAEFHIGVEEICYNGNFFSVLSQEINRIPSVIDKYGPHGRKLGFFGKIFQKVQGYLMTWWLNRLTVADICSHELLCHGLHVRGRKLESALESSPK